MNSLMTVILACCFTQTAYAESGENSSAAKAALDTKSPLAYYISEYEVIDKEGAKPYSAQVDTTFKKYGGRYIVRGGKIDSLEGVGFKGGMVVIAFDDLEKARAWYNSPEYAAVRPIRHKTMKSRVYIIEGTKLEAK